MRVRAMNSPGGSPRKAETIRWKWQGENRRHLGQRTQVERFVQMGPDVFDDDVDPPLIIGCRGWFVLHLGDKGILRRGNGLFRFCEFAYIIRPKVLLPKR